MQAVKRNMRYATMGVHQARNVMNVRGSVRLPDADAGRDHESGRQAYAYQGVPPENRRTVTIPLSWALILLAIVALIFVIKIGGRLSRRAGETRQIASMEQAIAATIRENRDLTLEIAECRDSSRICYRAVQELGMMSSAAVEAVPVVAPDTRPYETQNAVSTAAASPIAAGLITGSR